MGLVKINPTENNSYSFDGNIVVAIIKTKSHCLVALDCRCVLEKNTLHLDNFSIKCARLQVSKTGKTGWSRGYLILAN